jgi:hypothetical protein
MSKPNRWKISYTWLLVTNALFIVLFYVLMQIFS